MSDPPSSKMMENKYTIIHIACEIVVVLGLVFYFNSKNKKVLGYIEELISKIDELEELNLGLEKAVKAHDKVIMNLSTQVSELKEFIKSLSSNAGKTELIFFHSTKHQLDYDNVYINLMEYD